MKHEGVEMAWESEGLSLEDVGLLPLRGSWDGKKAPSTRTTQWAKDFLFLFFYYLGFKSSSSVLPASVAGKKSKKREGAFPGQEGQ